MIYAKFKIYKFLKENPYTKYSAEELAKKFNLNTKQTSGILTRMLNRTYYYKNIFSEKKHYDNSSNSYRNFYWVEK